MNGFVRPGFFRRVLQVALVGGALGGFGACERRPSGSGEPPPEVMLEGVRFTFYEGAQLAAKGRADRLTFQRSSADFVADRGEGRLYASPSSPARLGTGVDVRAARFRGNLAAQSATGEGDVQVRSDGGFTGQSAQAHYDGVSRTVSGQSPVHVDGPGYALDAEGGFHFDLTREAFVFEGPVHTTVGVPKDAPRAPAAHGSKGAGR